MCITAILYTCLSNMFFTVMNLLMIKQPVILFQIIYDNGCRFDIVNLGNKLEQLNLSAMHKMHV